MKCKSCEQNVDAKFKFAISTNVCPFCGEAIIDVALQAILNDLKTVMERGAEYMEDVENWLFSNYSLRKVNPNDVVDSSEQQFNFTNTQRPLKAGKGPMVNRVEDDMPANKEDNTTIFAKRAGITNFKKVLDHIKGAAEQTEFVDPELDTVVEETGEPLSTREQQEMISMLGSSNNSNQELELQKLKRLRAQSGGSGSFRRE
jgi:hypothetical protein